MVSILWLRQDLRTRDHPALCAAAQAGAVIPVYVFDEAAEIGAAQRWWLHHSLRALAADLAALGAPLVLRRGRSADVLLGLLAHTGAECIHATRHYEPWWQEAENEIAGEARLVLHEGNHLINPRAVRSGSGERYRVFTPWWNKLQTMMPPPRPLPRPERIEGAAEAPASDQLDDWHLLPRRPDWAGGFAVWTPGEDGARAAFRQFLPQVGAYQEERNFPARAGVSRLSPHLHFGEISPATLWRHAANQAGAGAVSPGRA